MLTHEILLHDPQGPEDLKTRPLPTYDTEAGSPKFILSGDGSSIFKIERPGKVVVPLVEGGRDLPGLAMALIEAVLVEREGRTLEAGSVSEAVLLGAAALDGMDLKLGSVLVRTGTEVEPPMEAKVFQHDDVEPDLVVCLPSPEFLGRMPTANERFGMMIHNPSAVVPVRIVPS